MANNSEFYKGRKERRSYAFVIVIILIILVAALVVMFYGMQKYAVITEDKVNVELPILRDDSYTVDSSGNIVRNFDTVDAQIVFEQADFSGVKQTVDGNVSELRAIYISAQEMTIPMINEYSAQLNKGNALVMEMKPRTGNLLWNSQTFFNRGYALYTPTNDTEQLPQKLEELKKNGVYLVAQISCCIDSMLPARTLQYALTNSYGVYWADSKGTYVDPYNTDVRSYIVELVRELYALGFDEVVLADVVHPVTEDENASFVYTRSMSTTPTPVSAVCGFAKYVADALSDRDGKLSIYLDVPQALVRAETATGQDGELFMKLFDRVYYRTDKFAYSYNAADIQSFVTVGNVYDRLIPVVQDYIPDNSSWVYIDTGIDDE